MEPPEPLYLASLFRPLYEELYASLGRLGPEDWDRATASSTWKVKDVAAHLLDGDIRCLSFERDGVTPPPPEEPIRDYESLVRYLNHLNMTWTTAARRMSPSVLTGFIELLGPQVCTWFESLDPHEEALFGVAWAGEETSENWFDTAREYTERWHHQQQIREATGQPLLTDARWVRPFLDTLMRGLPHRYRTLEAAPGTAVGVEITGDAGGQWTLQRGASGWALLVGSIATPDATVGMHSETAWRLFSGRLSSEEARQRVVLTGPGRLVEPVFGYVGFMV